MACLLNIGEELSKIDGLMKKVGSRWSCVGVPEDLKKYFDSINTGFQLYTELRFARIDHIKVFEELKKLSKGFTGKSKYFDYLDITIQSIKRAITGNERFPVICLSNISIELMMHHIKHLYVNFYAGLRHSIETIGPICTHLPPHIAMAIFECNVCHNNFTNDVWWKHIKTCGCDRRFGNYHDSGID